MSKLKKIGLLQLIVLTLSAIISVKSLPLFAEIGLSLIFFLTIAMIFFFIPISMAIAELSSTWPSEGGCYLWIKKAYGENCAFIVMWAYWMESIIWFPTMLTFILAMLAYTISPIISNLETNPTFFICGIIIIFWILTYINFHGMQVSATFNTIGVICGTILPISLIIIFGITWVFKHENLSIIIKSSQLIPSFNKDNIVFFAGILLGISGIELIAFHTNSITNPKKNIPKAVLISSALIFFIYLAGSISIAIVVPKTEICLASGIIQALKIFFIKNNITIIIPLLSFLLLLGSLSSMNAWIIGPVKGIFITSEDGFLPKYLSKVNNKNIPINLLIIQAVIGSLLSITFFTFIDNLNGLIWIFICLSFQFSSLLYIMIFLSVIKLRLKYPNIYRPYKIPYIYILTSLGISISIFTFLTAYIQPTSITITNSNVYIILLLTSFILLLSPAYIFIYLKNKKKLL
ncbi:MAG TPA: APC family permease [Candidatus Azoamicus sp. OHIO2]